MNINLQNYEAWFLDYAEGTLDATRLSELMEFLETHPELEVELRKFENITLAPAEQHFAPRESLYHFRFETTPVTMGNFTEFCIASHENILPETKAAELHEFIKSHPAYELEYEEYKKVYLKPDFKIVFPAHNKLYRPAKTIILSTLKRMITGVAASAAIVTAIYFLAVPRQNQPEEIAATKNLQEMPKPKDKEIIPVNRPDDKKYQQKKIIKENTGTRIALMSADSLRPIIRDEVPEKKKLLAVAPLKAEKEWMTWRMNEAPDVSEQQKTRDFPDKTDNPLKNRKNTRFTLLALVEAGVNKIGEYTDTNIHLTHETNLTGQVTSLTFQSGRFSFHRSKGK